MAFEKLASQRQQPGAARLTDLEESISRSAGTGSELEPRILTRANHRDKNWLARRRMEPVPASNHNADDAGICRLMLSNVDDLNKNTRTTPTAASMHLSRALEVNCARN